MLNRLRITRIVIASVVFVVITLAFIDLSGGGVWSNFVLKTQFVPSLFSLLQGSVAAFVLLLVITILFGRVYCSFLCPLGILQDIIGRVVLVIRKKYRNSKGVKGTIKSEYRKPCNWLRYSILVIVGALFAFGISAPLLILDPYSNYGRIANKLFGNAIIGLNNLLSNLFPDTIYYQQHFTYTLYAFIFSLCFFIIILIFSVFWGRLYCNTICPVGTLLGLFSNFSLFKPAIKSDSCVNCNACKNSCKSNCIDLETKKIDLSRCVACYNCLPSCKRDAIHLEFSFLDSSKRSSEVNGNERGTSSQGRRNALIAFGLLGAAAVGAKLSRKKLSENISELSGDQHPIMPPGAGSLSHLKSYCTACQACIAACPNKIIKPAVLQYGIDGFMMPVIDFNDKFCAYDCHLCSDVCPNKALLPMTLAQKQRTQIGRASFKAKNCIVFKDGTDCGACDEHCPTKAITMTELKNKPGLYFPKLNRDICIGCGACQYICPASPKAMVVSGELVQGESLPPKVEKQEQKNVDDFGF